MRIVSKILGLTLVILGLNACDGFDFDSLNETTSEEKRFTSAELSFNVVFSSLLLNDSGFSTNRDGFVVLFTDSANLTEIELRNSGNNSALVGTYPWDIVNNELQVTYPDGVTCTSTKTSETSTQYEATNRCTGGEPNNDRIRNTLNIPASFATEDLEEQSITIENDDQDQRIEFYNNGSYEKINIDVNGDEVADTREIGTYVDDSDSNAELNDVVRLNNSTTGESTLLILLEGSSSSGTLMSIRYSAETEGTLEEVRIYDIEARNLWETDSQYDSITVDN